MANTILTQGTEIYCIAPTAVGSDTKAIFKLAGATEFNPGDETADEIATTELAERKTHTFTNGLSDPGEATITLQVDPTDLKHKLLYDLRGQALDFVVGWSDGSQAPGYMSDVLTIPQGRSWFKFSGFIKSFPFDFTASSVVKATMTIRRSGEGTWIPKAPEYTGG